MPTVELSLYVIQTSAALACSCNEPCLEAYLALNQSYASNSTKLITEKAN